MTTPGQPAMIAAAPDDTPPVAAVRTDLLALTQDALAALANRGLVRRAAKELDSGLGAALTVDADSTVRGAYPDGTRTTLAADPGRGLTAATCDCAAVSLCRHILGVVLAYQHLASPPPATGGAAPARTGDGPQPHHGGVSTATRHQIVEDWSPGAFTDDELAATLDRHAMTTARRALRAGYTARVRRPTTADPVPSVELPTCTVRFLVPRALGYAHSDAVEHREAVALAVWAFRAADARTRAAETVTVDVGGPAAGREPTESTSAGKISNQEVARDQGTSRRGQEAPDPLPPAAMQAEVSTGGASAGAGTTVATTAGAEALAFTLELVDELLLEGAAQAGPSLAGPLAHARRRLDAAGLRWPLLALDDLTDELTAYQARSALGRPERVAELVAELHARSRAATHRGDGTLTTPATILGTGEAALTRLRLTRFTGLGCRVSRDHAARPDQIASTAAGQAAPPAGTPAGDAPLIVDVYLAQPDTGTVLVLRKRWPAGDSAAPGHDLADRRITGVPLRTFATGLIVTESASRAANRTLRLTTSRVAHTTVSPTTGGESWATLPHALLVRDLAGARATLQTQPPRLVRPRIEAEQLRVVAIDQVRSIGYRPGDQRLDAVIADHAGATATISAVHRPEAPAALDTLAATLTTTGPHQPRWVSGTMSLTGGGLVIDPVAVATNTEIFVLDLAPGAGDRTLAPGAATETEPIQAAVDAALAVLAEAAHRGLRRLPTTFPTLLRAAGVALTNVGLTSAARTIDSLAAALGPNPGANAVSTWVGAELRLLVTAELT